MSNLANVVKTVLGSKFEAKNRVFEFDHQQMNLFEFVRCSKNDVRVRSMFDKMVFDPSLLKAFGGYFCKSVGKSRPYEDFVIFKNIH